MVRMDGRGRLCGPKITRFNSNFKLPRSREEKQELTVIIVSTEQLTLPTAYLQRPTSGPTEINKDTMVIIILKTSYAHPHRPRSHPLATTLCHHRHYHSTLAVVIIIVIRIFNATYPSSPPTMTTTSSCFDNPSVLAGLTMFFYSHTVIIIMMMHHAATMMMMMAFR